ncbi:putative peptidyl tRNA hydrolase [Mycobacterium phage Myrna]|uniref:peptidyl-tRNA hydrolase n=1 Tax=Mycobacterium phage Myrna TaxID=546805 RepID=B5LJ47_9CAUD|nr:gp36 [Mycobacterium phage Myrna]ACH62044.1 putative peptidyl tRNA hydrolase [Mycobacterium phage Myrna]
MKQVIVMRTDLGMRKGKMIAQGAHASLAAVLPYRDDFRVQAWLKNSFTKICLRVDSEEELMSIFAKAVHKGLICELITDSGKTEFHGVPTKTCLAIGPDLEPIIDEITGELHLL